MSKNYYFETLQKSLDEEKKTPDSVLNLLENTDFFFKVLKVKFESGDPDLINQGIEELKHMKELLEKHESTPPSK